jgi:hypothetical protein
VSRQAPARPEPRLSVPLPPHSEPAHGHGERHTSYGVFSFVWTPRGSIEFCCCATAGNSLSAHAHAAPWIDQQARTQHRTAELYLRPLLKSEKGSAAGVSKPPTSLKSGFQQQQLPSQLRRLLWVPDGPRIPTKRLAHTGGVDLPDGRS